jgi:hypothetical protein
MNAGFPSSNFLVPGAGMAAAGRSHRLADVPPMRGGVMMVAA